MKLIHDVNQKILKYLPDERGRLMEILRKDDVLFQKFGQIYMTTNYPGVIKAWHYHKIQTDNICCLKGMIKVVLFDGRNESPTKGLINEFYMGEYNPLFLSIPPGIYHGWKCISETESIVINMPTETYDYSQPDEFRLKPDSDQIPYKWEFTPGTVNG